MNRKLIIAIALILAALAGACAPGLVAVWLYTTRPDPEAEYWRGVYDVCLWQTHQPEMCLESVRGFHAEHRDDWYIAPSPGYEWPLPHDGAPRRPYPSDQAQSY